MRKLRLLTKMESPDGELPPGSVLVVDDAEAQVLRGAIGLVEDLGEHIPELAVAGTEQASAAPANGEEPLEQDAATGAGIRGEPGATNAQGEGEATGASTAKPPRKQR